MGKKLKSIYELLPEYSTKDIDRVIAELNEDEQLLIKRRYSTTQKFNNPNFTPEDRYKFYGLLMAKIERNLVRINKGPRKIYDYFPGKSKKQVDEAILHLDNRGKELLKQRFGEDLEKPILFINNKNKVNMVEFHKKVIYVIKKYLKNGTLSRKIKTIYELLPEYEKGKINNAIEQLSAKEKHIIFLKYGKDLEHPETSSEWNQEYAQEFKTVFAKIKKILKHKTIYDYFSNVSKERIDKAVNVLEKNDQAGLILLYGYDMSKLNEPVSLENIVLSKTFKKEILKKIERRLRRLDGKRKYKTIYRLFSEFSKEEVNAMINKLNDKDKNLIRLRYGDDLDNPRVSPEWNEIYSSQFYSLTQKMYRLLLNVKASIHAVTVYDYFEEYSKEQINTLLIELTFEEKVLIYKRYGKDLNNPQRWEFWTKQDSAKFTNLINRLKTKVKKAKNIDETLFFEQDEEYQTIISIFDNPNSKIINKDNKFVDDVKKSFAFENLQIIWINLSNEEQMVATLRFKENRSIEDISSILHLSVDEVIIRLRTIILLYKKSLLINAAQEPLLDTNLTRSLKLPDANNEE